MAANLHKIGDHRLRGYAMSEHDIVSQIAVDVPAATPGQLRMDGTVFRLRPLLHIHLTGLRWRARAAPERIWEMTDGR